MDLVLNNLQCLICRKNQAKPKQTKRNWQIQKSVWNNLLKLLTFTTHSFIVKFTDVYFCNLQSTHYWKICCIPLSCETIDLFPDLRTELDKIRWRSTSCPGSRSPLFRISKGYVLSNFQKHFYLKLFSLVKQF